MSVFISVTNRYDFLIYIFEVCITWGFQNGMSLPCTINFRLGLIYHQGAKKSLYSYFARNIFRAVCLVFAGNKTNLAETPNKTPFSRDAPQSVK